jgi:hypothetical protein
MKVKGQTPDREHHWALSARRNLIPALGYLCRRIFTFVALLLVGCYLVLVDGCFVEHRAVECKWHYAPDGCYEPYEPQAPPIPAGCEWWYAPDCNPNPE